MPLNLKLIKIFVFFSKCMHVCYFHTGVDCGDIFSGAYTTYQCVHAHSLTDNNFVLLQSFRDNVDWPNMDAFVKRSVHFF